MPTSSEVRSLLRAFLRQGRRISNYNIREYTVRKARDSFRSSAGVTDKQQQQELWAKAKQQYDVISRQAIVYSLYARKQRSVMDVPLGKVLENQPSLAESKDTLDITH